MQCYLPPADGDEDPAVYRSSKSKRSARDNEVTNGKTAGSPKTNGHDPSAGDVEDEEAMSDEEVEDDGGPLLTVQPGFNRLLLVLRDERVMHFVKYLSATAPGCRWDVCGEWEVGMVEESEEASASE